jgi:aspartate/methionine/tyrosine aminotransferase
MVIPERLFEPVRKIQDTILICAPVVSQWAAVGAMRVGKSYCEEKLREIREIRTIFLKELESLRDLVTVPRADGAFYLLLGVHTKMDPMQLVRRLVEEHKVAVIPGTTFGVQDRCLLRVAYGALRKDTATEGVGRLVHGLRQILSD